MIQKRDDVNNNRNFPSPKTALWQSHQSTKFDSIQNESKFIITCMYLKDKVQLQSVPLVSFTCFMPHTNLCKIAEGLWYQECAAVIRYCKALHSHEQSSKTHGLSISRLLRYHVPVNSKTAHPRANPGHLTRLKLRIWPKMRPARWGIWLSCQNVCQQSQAKGLRNSLF